MRDIIGEWLDSKRSVLSKYHDYPDWYFEINRSDSVINKIVQVTVNLADPMYTRRVRHHISAKQKRSVRNLIAEFNQVSRKILANYELDHILPIMFYGSNIQSNLCLVLPYIHGFKHALLNTQVHKYTESPIRIYLPIMRGYYGPEANFT